MTEGKYVFQPRRPIYIYLRCRAAIEDDEAAGNAADDMFRELMMGDWSTPIDDAELMAPAEDYYTLGDGFVVRVKTEKLCTDVASGWKDHLSNFSAWAIHDGKSDVVEGGDSIGQVKSALQALRFSRSPPVTQAFVIYRGPDDETETTNGGEISEAVRATWGMKSQPAFHFRNGRVLLVSSEAVAETLMQKMRPRFPEGGCRIFHEVAFDDGDGGPGRTYFGTGRTWTPYEF